MMQFISVKVTQNISKYIFGSLNAYLWSSCLTFIVIKSLIWFILASFHDLHMIVLISRQ